MVDNTLVCPECGLSLTGIDLEGHALSHYPEYLDPAKSSKLAIKRQKQILAGGVTKDTFVKEHSEV